MRRMGWTAGAALVCAWALGACTSDDLDCSLGAMKPTCPPGTLGFDTMSARLRISQRQCLQKGLEPGGDAYAACLAETGPSRPPARTTPYDHVGAPPGPAPSL